MSNGYNNYVRNEVEGASPGRLVVMMYDAAVRFMTLAIKAIDEKNIQDAHNNIIKAENIFYELMSTLNTDEGGEIAQTLLGLYDFIIWELVHANSTKNKEKIEAVIKLINPVRSAWKEIVSKESSSQATQPTAEEIKKSINISG